MDPEDFGVCITVDLSSGDAISGWLVGETALGIYVALDLEGQNVRFVRAGQYDSISYDHEAPRATAAIVGPIGHERIDQERIEAFLDTAGTPLNRALDRLNYSRLRSLGQRFRYTSRRNASRRRDSDDDDDVELLRYLPLREDYIQLLDELDNAGMLEVIVERSDDIRGLVSAATVPLIDTEVVPPMILTKIIAGARQTNLVGETHAGRQYIEQITSERVVTAIRRPKKAVEEQKKGRRTRRLRVIGASGKIAVGGGLAVTNASLGVLAGVISALPTLGLGTVTAVVGIASSTYTGLNCACDALKDLAAALE